MTPPDAVFKTHPGCDDLRMPSAIETEQAQAVLARLRLLGQAHDGEYSARVRSREAQLGAKVYGVERAKLGAEAPQAVAPEVGGILYSLVLAARPGLVVEFGASFGPRRSTSRPR